MKKKGESKIRIVVLGLLAIFAIFPLIFLCAVKFAKYASARSKKRRFALYLKGFATRVILLPKGSLSTPWQINSS